VSGSILPRQKRHPLGLGSLRRESKGDQVGVLLSSRNHDRLQAKNDELHLGMAKAGAGLENGRDFGLRGGLTGIAL
jgi:hypothetical protein